VFSGFYGPLVFPRGEPAQLTHRPDTDMRMALRTAGFNKGTGTYDITWPWPNNCANELVLSRSGFRFFNVPHINNRPLKTNLSHAKLKLNRCVGRQRQPKKNVTLRAPD
jgi:hypothetical protein